MTIANLTPEIVAKLTEPGLYWDETLKGFGLNVRRDARGNIQRSFIIQYRVGKQQRKLKLGDARKLGIKQARRKAEEHFARITLGQDPQGERKAERAIPALTLRAGLEKYVEMKEDELRQGLYRPSSFRVTKLYLLGERYFGPLHRLDINAVTRQAVAAQLHEIRRASSDGTAGRARAQLAAAFTRLMQEGLCEQNPTIGTKTQQERPQRDRVLDNSELAAVWRACEDAGEFGVIIRLLVLSGCRRSEIGSMCWSWLNLEQNTLTIPGTHTKNHRELQLPLTGMMRSIIASVPRMVGSDYLFGARQQGFKGWQKHRLADGISKPWRIHDIRRSVATGMADLGILPHVIENVLNHASGHKSGIAGIYNRSTGAREMRNALAVWSDHVRSIVTGDARKVVALASY